MGEYQGPVCRQAGVKGIDRLLEDVLVDAYAEDEQLRQFWQTGEDAVPLSAGQ